MRKLFLLLILLGCLYAVPDAAPGASFYDGPRFDAGARHQIRICNGDDFDNDDDDPADSMLTSAGVLPDYKPHDTDFSFERFVRLNESLLPDRPSIALSFERGPPSRLF